MRGCSIEQKQLLSNEKILKYLDKTGKLGLVKKLKSNVEPNPYGRNRPDGIYLGDTNGLFTKKANEWVNVQDVEAKTIVGKQLTNWLNGNIKSLLSILDPNVNESRLDEIGGYDSPELGAAHGASTMGMILETFKHISDDFSKLNNMGNDILDDKLAKETRILLKRVQPLMERYGKAWTDAEKRRLSK